MWNGTCQIFYLTRKDCEWNWSPECEAAFGKVKTKYSDTTVLAYFDNNEKTKLQGYSSKDGIGAVIMQEGHPV